MIRFARLVPMLAFAFAQAAAVECPMASPAHERAPAHAVHRRAEDAPAGHAPAGHVHGSHGPAGRHHDAGHDAGHGTAACTLVMACGTAAVASAEVAAPRPPTSATQAPARVAQLYASPCMPIDAPPPRPSAAA
jgi:hypothetical protein